MMGYGFLALLYVATVLIVAGIILSRPYEVLRPSLWFCTAMLVTISPAAAFANSELDRGLEGAGILRLGVLTFPLVIVAWIALTPRLSSIASTLYRTCHSHPAPKFDMTDKATVGVIACISIGILVVYLATVPLRSLGLVAIFTNPENAALAREHSLKLLSSSFVKYAFLFHCAVLAPVLIGLMFLWKPRGAGFRGILWGIAVPLLFLSVVPTGARSPAARLLLALAIVYVFRKGVIRRGAVLPLAALAGGLFVTFLTVARNGMISELSVDLMAKFMHTGVFNRLFIIPFKTGILTNLYAQEHGLLGVSGIRPLAMLAGADYLNVPNVVALTYGRNPLASSSANTSFLFAFQACFGMWAGWGVSAILLCGLDYVLHFFRGLKPALLPAFLATLLTATLSLLSSAYTTCLLSHGILPCVALATAVQFVSQWLARRKPADHAVSHDHHQSIRISIAVPKPFSGT